MKLIFWVPLVLIGWYGYFSGRFTGMIVLIPLVIASSVMALGVRRGYRKAAAANNVVAAAATYASLTSTLKADVHERTMEIIKRSPGWEKEDPTFSDEAQRFGWYALAMAEMGITPICLIGGWSYVRNPFVAIFSNDSNIDTALMLAKKAGHEVTILRTPTE